eukprot:872647-Amorphochlora_amoeboformis.AAC.1
METGVQGLEQPIKIDVIPGFDSDTRNTGISEIRKPIVSEESPMGVLSDRKTLRDKDGKKRWKIIERIGKGSFAEIYSARDLVDKSIVAVKVANSARGATKQLRHEHSVLKALQGHCRYLTSSQSLPNPKRKAVMYR